MKSIEINNISKSYNLKDEKKNVLKDFSLQIHSGEIICILGNTGCGKTTLLRIISGFEKADSGCMMIDNQPLVVPNKDVIFVQQDLNQLFPWKKMIDNVMYPLIATKSCKKNEARDIALALLSELDLTPYMNYYPYQMSGGMRQRGVFARAIVSSPRLLLLDECFASLDEVTRRANQKVLLKTQQSKKFTVLFVTHSIDEAIFLADRIVILGNNNNGIIADIVNPVKNYKERNNEYYKMLNTLYEYLSI